MMNIISLLDRAVAKMRYESQKAAGNYLQSLLEIDTASSLYKK